MATKRQFPKSVRILGETFRVEVVDQTEEVDEDGTSPHGIIQFDSRVIKIKGDLTIRQQYRTLVHEALHAVLAVSGMEELCASEEVEEGFVRALEHGMCQLIEQIGPELAINLVDEYREYPE